MSVNESIAVLQNLGTQLEQVTGGKHANSTAELSSRLFAEKTTSESYSPSLTNRFVNWFRAYFTSKVKCYNKTVDVHVSFVSRVSTSVQVMRSLLQQSTTSITSKGLEEDPRLRRAVEYALSCDTGTDTTSSSHIVMQQLEDEIGQANEIKDLLPICKNPICAFSSESLSKIIYKLNQLTKNILKDSLSTKNIQGVNKLTPDQQHDFLEVYTLIVGNRFQQISKGGELSTYSIEADTVLQQCAIPDSLSEAMKIQKQGAEALAMAGAENFPELVNKTLSRIDELGEKQPKVAYCLISHFAVSLGVIGGVTQEIEEALNHSFQALECKVSTREKTAAVGQSIPVIGGLFSSKNFLSFATGFASGFRGGGGVSGGLFKGGAYLASNLVLSSLDPYINTASSWIGEKVEGSFAKQGAGERTASVCGSAVKWGVYSALSASAYLGLWYARDHVHTHLKLPSQPQPPVGNEPIASKQMAADYQAGNIPTYSQAAGPETLVEHWKRVSEAGKALPSVMEAQSPAVEVAAARTQCVVRPLWGMDIWLRKAF